MTNLMTEICCFFQTGSRSSDDVTRHQGKIAKNYGGGRVIEPPPPPAGYLMFLIIYIKLQNLYEKITRPHLKSLESVNNFNIEPFQGHVHANNE